MVLWNNDEITRIPIEELDKKALISVFSGGGKHFIVDVGKRTLTESDEKIDKKYCKDYHNHWMNGILRQRNLNGILRQSRMDFKHFKAKIFDMNSISYLPPSSFMHVNLILSCWGSNFSEKFFQGYDMPDCTKHMILRTYKIFSHLYKMKKLRKNCFF